MTLPQVISDCEIKRPIADCWAEGTWAGSGFTDLGDPKEDYKKKQIQEEEGEVSVG